MAIRTPLEVRVRSCGLYLSCLLAVGCQTPLPRHPGTPPKPFQFDGCTGVPDLDMTACCLQHDQQYWAGGSCSERKHADRVLQQCVTSLGHPWRAQWMYLTVRLAGAPIWPVPWRWGFGWPYGTGYSAPCQQQGCIADSAECNGAAGADQ